MKNISCFLLYKYAYLKYNPHNRNFVQFVFEFSRRNISKMAMAQALLLLRNSDKSEYEIMSILDFLKVQCLPCLTCPKFLAIREHMEDFCDELSIHTVDNEIVKNAYEKEFWHHAPSKLKELKQMLKNDSSNHHVLDKYCVQFKLYKYQIKNPLYKLPSDPDHRRFEKRRIVKHMSKYVWDDSDSE